jgi:hypothetical protein
MKTKLLFILTLFFMLFGCQSNQESINQVIDRSLHTAAQHALNMANELKNSPELLPRSVNKETGQLITSKSSWWCSGFFPGVLWYLYEFSGDTLLKTNAIDYTARVEREKHTTDNHDVGFMLYCSFGNGLRITGEKSYEEVLLTGSKSLATRYDSVVGLIRSWDFKQDVWQYPVIIDNMMNLELLLWAFEFSDDSVFYNIAISHADKTLKNHYREDNSCFHVVSYDTISGLPEKKQTQQGASDSSLWARGQSWGLYGFTMMYRETGLKRYLDQAIKIAELLIHHPNMPSDYIPYWDFLAPNIPNEERDASAAAIMASALIELSGYAPEQQKTKYLQVAGKQIRKLASSDYMAKPGSNGNFILKHNVGSKPERSEVDVPLTYADYYFVEALLRYNKLLSN